MGLYLGGLIIGRIFASEIWGACFWEGLFLGGAYYRNITVVKHFTPFVHILYFFRPRNWGKKAHFLLKMASLPATYDVISRNRSNRCSPYLASKCV